MRNRIWTAFIPVMMMIMIASSAFARKKDRDNDSDGDFPPRKSSTENRVPGSTYIMFEPVGLSTYLTQGIHVGTIDTSDTLYEASYIVGQSNLSGVDKFKNTKIMARGRFFVANSFNLTGGIAYRKVLVNFAAERELSYQSYDHTDESATVTDFGGVFTLGNRWQFSGFSIGADWFGFYIPWSDSKVVYTDNIDSTDISKSDEVEEAKNGDVFLVNFHLGFIF